MTQTEHYNLNKPESNDYVQIAALNENSDAIDEALHDLDTAVASLGNGKAPATHAAQHGAGGGDPVTPAAIGARPNTWVPAWGEVTGKPGTFAPAVHKATHASGGADALSPGDIGAAPASHSHAVGNLPAQTTITNSSSNIPTSSAVVSLVGRSTAVTAADTNYSSYMARGEALVPSDTTPSYNGQIAWTYG